MGHYTDMLHNQQRIMRQYAHLMDDYGKAWNENKLWTLQLKAQQEMEQEITKNVLAYLTKEGGKAAKDIANELQKALKSIKL